MSLSDSWDVLVLGLVLGSLYAVIAIGYTLVYGVLQLLNFAHSEVFMAGGFGGVIALTIFEPAVDPSGMQSVVYVLLGIAAGAVLGGVIAFGLEKAAYRPLRRRNAPRLVFLITAIGASFFLYNLAGKLFGRYPIAMPSMYENKTVFTLFGTSVSVTQLLIVGAALVMLVAVDVIVNRTKLGSGIRAVAQDPEVAALMGVDIDKVVSRTFVLGGLLGGVAGFLFGTNLQVEYTMGFLPGITAFAAAVLGGIGNVRGAVLGGLLLGVVEAFTVEIWSDAWRYVGAFAVLVLVLMFRPTGLLGERVGRTA
ncbi:amino acid/amide ABC transporter membrane protein 1, HAAT family [Streptomyces zhaozhouensis]|uniref:Amino acid/amide ABC transporter membrane protein 1, HAAT family n=1 Tax=Streptomyces zhaozhouensis TaxID=1300267 RepID=A0A286DIM0_9ACTN|nr:branched-chain amino acid ABC transporter permease [Streptomyces zhaozhouensis]SOD58498.1 amino acid/amide ABC transporter membrane protein 1, HAAT family [Streptomyces zhaozhouensis]